MMSNDLTCKETITVDEPGTSVLVSSMLPSTSTSKIVPTPTHGGSMLLQNASYIHRPISSPSINASTSKPVAQQYQTQYTNELGMPVGIGTQTAMNVNTNLYLQAHLGLNWQSGGGSLEERKLAMESALRGLGKLPTVSTSRMTTPSVSHSQPKFGTNVVMSSMGNTQPSSSISPSVYNQRPNTSFGNDLVGNNSRVITQQAVHHQQQQIQQHQRLQQQQLQQQHQQQQQQQHHQQQQQQQQHQQQQQQHHQQQQQHHQQQQLHQQHHQLQQQQFQQQQQQQQQRHLQQLLAQQHSVSQSAMNMRNGGAARATPTPIQRQQHQPLLNNPLDSQLQAQLNAMLGLNSAEALIRSLPIPRHMMPMASLLPASITQQLLAVSNNLQEQSQQQQQTPHLTPTSSGVNLQNFQPNSSPRPQPSILRRKFDHGASPNLKRRIDEMSRPASGNGTATPSGDGLSKAVRSLQPTFITSVSSGDDTNDAPHTEENGNGESPRKRIRKQTFDGAETSADTVKMLQLTNPLLPQPAIQIPLPKRRGRPPRCDSRPATAALEQPSQLSGILLDLDSDMKGRRIQKKTKETIMLEQLRKGTSSVPPVFDVTLKDKVKKEHTREDFAVPSSTTAQKIPLATKNVAKKEETATVKKPPQFDISVLGEDALPVTILQDIREQTAHRLLRRNAAWKVASALADHSFNFPFKVDDDLCGDEATSSHKEILEEARKRLDPFDVQMLTPQQLSSLKHILEGRVVVKNINQFQSDALAKVDWDLNNPSNMDAYESFKAELIAHGNKYHIPEKILKEALRLEKLRNVDRLNENLEAASQSLSYDKATAPDEIKECLTTTNTTPLMKTHHSIEDQFKKLWKDVTIAQEHFLNEYIGAMSDTESESGSESEGEEEKPKTPEKVEPTVEEDTTCILLRQVQGSADPDVEKQEFATAISMTVESLVRTTSERDNAIDDAQPEEKPKRKHHKKFRRFLRYLRHRPRDAEEEKVKEEHKTQDQCTCPVDVNAATVEDMKTCGECSSLSKSATRHDVPCTSHERISRAVVVSRERSMVESTVMLNKMMKEFEKVLKLGLPDVHQKFLREAQMDREEFDTVETLKWKRIRRLQTIATRLPVELPPVASYLNDCSVDAPTPWKVNHLLGPLSPFWRGPLRRVNRPNSYLSRSGFLIRDRVDGFVPLRYPSSILPDEILPTTKEDEKRLLLAESSLKNRETWIDEILRCYAKFSVEEVEDDVEDESEENEDDEIDALCSKEAIIVRESSGSCDSPSVMEKTFSRRSMAFRKQKMSANGSVCNDVKDGDSIPSSVTNSPNVVLSMPKEEETEEGNVVDSDVIKENVKVESTEEPPQPPSTSQVIEQTKIKEEPEEEKDSSNSISKRIKLRTDAHCATVKELFAGYVTHMEKGVDLLQQCSTLYREDLYLPD